MNPMLVSSSSLVAYCGLFLERFSGNIDDFHDAGWISGTFCLIICNA